MAQITIDGKEYDSEKLSDEVKARINSVRATDNKIAELNRELAIAQTARNSYFVALKEALDDKQDSEVKKK